MSLNPLSRLEKFLAKIAGKYDDIEPLSRTEHFLDDIAGRVNTIDKKLPASIRFRLIANSEEVECTQTPQEIFGLLSSHETVECLLVWTVKSGTFVDANSLSLPNVHVGFHVIGTSLSYNVQAEGFLQTTDEKDAFCWKRYAVTMICARHGLQDITVSAELQDPIFIYP